MVLGRLTDTQSPAVTAKGESTPTSQRKAPQPSSEACRSQHTATPHSHSDARLSTRHPVQAARQQPPYSPLTPYSPSTPPRPQGPWPLEWG